MPCLCRSLTRVVISQLTERFSTQSTKACQLSALLPDYCSGGDFQDVKPACIARRQCRRPADRICSLAAVLETTVNRPTSRLTQERCVSPTNLVLTAVSVLLRIFVTLPVTTATGERKLQRAEIGLRQKLPEVYDGRRSSQWHCADVY